MSLRLPAIGSFLTLATLLLSTSAGGTLSAPAHAQPPVCQVITADQVDGAGMSTSAIQAQLDACAAATNLVSVELSPAHGANFVSGPVYVPSNVVLWLDAGVVLNASTNPADFQRTATSRTSECDSTSTNIPMCGSLAVNSNGCQALINACKVSNSGVGGPGLIEGHGWDTLADGNNGGSSWWARSVTAKVGNYAVNLNAPAIINFSNSSSISFTDFAIHNAPHFHMTLGKDSGILISGLTIVTPSADHTVSSYPYNTDGIDPSGSTNIQIDQVDITAGDDNIAFKAGSNGPINHVSVTNSTLRAGHGLSIGSETNAGVSDVTASNINFIGTDNGLRIKSDISRGGLVDRIRYSNICVQGVKNPIVIDPAYSTATGSLPPQYRNIEIDNFYADSGALTLKALAGQPPMSLTLDNVRMANPGAIAAANVNITELYDPSYPFTLPISSAPGITVTQAAQTANPPADIKAFCQAQLGLELPSVTVAADGSGDFTTVQSAIDAAPSSGQIIFIKPGIYQEQITVTKPYMQIRGLSSDPSQVVLTYNLNNALAGGSTSKSASTTITNAAHDFYASNVTFHNSSGLGQNLMPNGSQAVALYVTADRAAFRHCRFISRQDTLYADHQGCASSTSCRTARQYYADSYIEGNVDFIFGDAKAVFDNCEIHAVVNSVGKEEMLTAQSKLYPGEDSGYVFQNCTVTADPAAVNVYLGRPWKPYSTVTYLNTVLPAQVPAAGWLEWQPGITNYLQTATYSEFDSAGPGANPTGREPYSTQLLAPQISGYDPAVYLAGSDGWNPLNVPAPSMTNPLPQLSVTRGVTTGISSSRVWTLNVANTGAGATAATVKSVTLTPTAGSCTARPVATVGAAPNLGGIPSGSSASTQVTIDFSGCATAVRYRADVSLTANNNGYSSTVTLLNQFQ